jgi:UDPglucose--hexose-1-phosphate uridylyltransferase
MKLDVNQKNKKKIVELSKKQEAEKVKEKECFGEKVSELRQDLVSGDWVVIATGRGKRPDDFKNKEKELDAATDPSECLFCNPEKSGQEEDVLIYKTSSDDWTLRVFPNKYPAFARPDGKINHQEQGPYFWMDGVGYHEVVVFRDHDKQIGQMEELMVAEILDAYQTRYLDLMNKKSVRYIEIFHNHGKSAGASISHPHSQLVAIPVISPYVNLELVGAEQYFSSNKKCVYCAMIQWETEHQQRIVFENDSFIAFCPFASRAAFEIWVLPKNHQPYFERSSDEDKISAAQALREALGAIMEKLGSPAYNFYLHTSPCDGKDYEHYHWHIEILPKTSVWAGFELSTGIEVSTIKPEDAAKYLREQ